MYFSKGRNFHGQVGSSSALWSERQRSDRRFSSLLLRIGLVICTGSLCQLSLHTSHKLGPIYPEHPALNGNDYQDSQTLFTQYVFIKVEKKKEMTYSISRTVSKRGGRKEELNVCYVLVLQTNTKDHMCTIRQNACLVYSLTLRVHLDTVWISRYTQKENVFLLK